MILNRVVEEIGYCSLSVLECFSAVLKLAQIPKFDTPFGLGVLLLIAHVICAWEFVVCHCQP